MLVSGHKKEKLVLTRLLQDGPFSRAGGDTSSYLNNNRYFKYTFEGLSFYFLVALFSICFAPVKISAGTGGTFIF